MLEVTRVFDAPAAQVFRAWTEAEEVKRWWGPNGFTTPECSIDLRPGGVWHLCMRAADGKDYWSRGVYREIVDGEKLVTTDSFSDEQGNVVPPTRYGMGDDWPAETELTVVFSGMGAKTNLTLRHGIPDALVDSSGAREGWSQSLDRLATHLAATRP